MKLSILLIVILIVRVFAAENFATLQSEVLALAEHISAPAVWDASDDANTSSGERLKAIYFEGVPYRGEPTRVFAWLGLPENSSGRVPGVVLVHGGGGTAFKQWVQKWNDHGFAAISIAVEGQTDVRTESNSWQRHAWSGPARSGIYSDSDQPLPDQWIYHAATASILANSLLRSLPEVDEDAVGISGISWGGVATATVMGIDDRFAFAIPIYGCGQMHLVENQWGRALSPNALYRNVWDPMLYLHRAKMPALWLSWPEENHFPLTSQAASYRATTGPYMVSLIPGMKHSHPHGWNPPDSYAFAKSVLEEGAPWCRQLKYQVLDNECRVVFTSTKRLESAVLISTSSSGFTGDREWVESPATLERDGERWIANATLPPESTAWFINVHSGGLTVSSEFYEVE
jgi:dienelactone hydrolase